MTAMLSPIWAFLRSTIRQLLWWAALGLLMPLAKAPLFFHIAAPLTSVALLACLPELLRRGKETEHDLRPSPTLYVLLNAQRSLLVLFFVWSWRDSAAAWMVYAMGAMGACYTAYETAQVVQLAREVRERGLDRVANERLATLMAKDPCDPFRKVREYCFEMRKTDVEYRLSDAISERMDRLWDRMKEYQRTPGG